MLRDAELVAVVSTESTETHSIRLFRQLKILLEEQCLAMPAFDLYAVASGPGSFTGVRVGLTAVKGWAEVYQKPAVPVSALEAVAVQAPDGVPLVAALLDARRGQVYAGLYELDGDPESRLESRNLRTGLRRRGEDVVMSLQECVTYLASQARGETFVCVTPVPDWLATILADSPLRGVRIAAASPVLAPAIGRIALERARRGELCDAVSLDAHYVRRSDAELFWKPQ